MNNCLVTKLKAAVDNADLLKMGEFRFRAFGSSTPLRVRTFPKEGETLTLTIIDGGLFYNNNSKTIEVTTANAGSIRITEESVISVMEKYNIASLGETYYGNGASAKSLNLDDLKFVEGMTCVSIGQNTDSTGSIKSLVNSADTLLYLELGGSGIDYSLIALPNLIFCSLWPTKTAININELIAKCPSIETIYGNYTGDVSAFNGKTSLKVVDFRDNHTLAGNISVFAGNSGMTELRVNNTEVRGRLSSILACTGLKVLSIAANVEYTAADADAMDAILSGNGATNKYEHTENGVTVQRYFSNGTFVESYT